MGEQPLPRTGATQIQLALLLFSSHALAGAVAVAIIVGIDRQWWMWGGLAAALAGASGVLLTLSLQRGVHMAEATLTRLAAGQRSGTLPPGLRWPLTQLLAAVDALGAHERDFRARHAQLLSKELEAATQAERTRLAHELHDSAIQSVSGVANLADAALTQLEHNPALAQETLVKLRKGAHQAHTTLRLLVDQLRLPLTAEAGLRKALRELCQSAGEQSEVEVEAILPDSLRLDNLTAEAQEDLAWIAKAALDNIVSHAQAQQAIVLLNQAPDTLMLEIRDDGCGFNAARPGGIGLRSMTERARRLGGTLDMRSTPGEGTTIRVRVPLVDQGQVEKDDAQDPVSIENPAEHPLCVPCIIAQTIFFFVPALVGALTWGQGLLDWKSALISLSFGVATVGVPALSRTKQLVFPIWGTLICFSLAISSLVGLLLGGTSRPNWAIGVLLLGGALAVAGEVYGALRQRSAMREHPPLTDSTLQLRRKLLESRSGVHMFYIFTILALCLFGIPALVSPFLPFALAVLVTSAFIPFVQILRITDRYLRRLPLERFRAQSAAFISEQKYFTVWNILNWAACAAGAIALAIYFAPFFAAHMAAFIFVEFAFLIGLCMTAAGLVARWYCRRWRNQLVQREMESNEPVIYVEPTREEQVTAEVGRWYERAKRARRVGNLIALALVPSGFILSIGAHGSLPTRMLPCLFLVVCAKSIGYGVVRYCYHRAEQALRRLPIDTSMVDGQRSDRSDLSLAALRLRRDVLWAHVRVSELTFWAFFAAAMGSRWPTASPYLYGLAACSCVLLLVELTRFHRADHRHHVQQAACDTPLQPVLSKYASEATLEWAELFWFTQGLISRNSSFFSLTPGLLLLSSMRGRGARPAAFVVLFISALASTNKALLWDAIGPLLLTLLVYISLGPGLGQLALARPIWVMGYFIYAVWLVVRLMNHPVREAQ